ncbi:hypothetical protein BCV70DRAFT_143861, partial [Testicularia cyperi]
QATQQSESTTSDRPVKRRNRKAVSCVSCREKKIKCDRVVPCIQCIKRGEQHLCRIEQKPKILHDNANATKQTINASDLVDPLSPGSAAYNQFSAAITSARSQVDAAQTTHSPPPAEVEAIKARLAQVEALLAGQTLMSGASGLSPSSNFPNMNLSPSNWDSYRNANSNLSGIGASGNVASSSAISPDSLYAAYRSSSHPSSTHYPSVSPRNQPADTDDSDDEDENSATARSSPHAHAAASSRRVSPVNRLKTNDMPVSRSEMDSDTEDAAMVLERLAMDGGPQSKWGESAGPGKCPSQSATAAGSKQGFSSADEAPTGQKFEACLRRDKEVGIMSMETGEKFERCLEKEKHADTQSAGRDVVSSNGPSPATRQALASTDLPPADAVPLPMPHSERQGAATGSNQTGLLLPPMSADANTMTHDHDADGFPTCACRGTEDSNRSTQGTDNSMPGSDDQSRMLACLTKHQPLSKEPAPISIPCRLACQNEGLMRLKSGPETLFGWGMGWAWAAAEVLLQQEVQQAHKDGRKFVVTQRTEREAVLRAVCESLPSKEIAHQLVEVYESRVRYLGGHVVHVPCLKREMEAFYALDSVEKRARVVNHVDPGWLGMFLTVLALGVRFYPCVPKAGWKPVSHLFDGKTIHAWHSAAKTCLVLAGYLNSSSMSVVQAILLLYLFNSTAGSSCGGETDSGSTSTALLRIAITNAQEMGLHRLGDLDKQPVPNEPSSKIIRREIAKRIWWALVFRDWSAAGTGCAKDYVIRADSFNTPLPGNYNDDDLLCSPLPPPRPREEITEMSYVLSNIEFGMVVKEDVDIRQRRELHAATSGGDRRLTCAESRRLDMLYRAVLENAPAYFKVGSEIGRVTCIEVQRWLLQQSVFSKLLRIHRPNLSSRKDSRTNCVLLARSILDMQKKIRSRCTVIDRLWVNLMQSFSAAIVLALHLLHTRQSLEHRLSVRSEITEAIRALKQVDGSDCAAKKCIRVIEALLEEEEERWQAGNSVLTRKEEPNSASGPAAADAHKQKRKRQLDVEGDAADASLAGGRRKNLLSLAQRVAVAAQGDSAQQSVSKPASVSQAEDSSKRQATAAAVHAQQTGSAPAPIALIAQMQSSLQGTPQAATFDVNGVAAMKDDASRMRMNAMTLPSGMYGSFANAPGAPTDDVPFPEMMPTAVHHNAAFDFSNVSNAGSAANTTNAAEAAAAAQRMPAPNGVDLMMNHPITPPDGQPFDLAAFLEQVENSPSSSTEGSLSSAHEERSTAASSEYSGHDDRASNHALGNGSVAGDLTDATSVSTHSDGSLLTREAIRKQQQQLQRGVSSSSSVPLSSSTQASSPTDPISANPTTDMDSFWNWIITQGANGITANTNATPALPATLVQPESVQTPKPAARVPQATGQAAQSRTGWTPFLGPNGFFNGADANVSMPASAAMSMPVTNADLAVPFYPTASKAAGTANEDVQMTPQPMPTQVGSVGTPSAGFGLETYLGAPLYDFTDFANAWTASNPGAPLMPGSSQGPISDP